MRKSTPPHLTSLLLLLTLLSGLSGCKQANETKDLVQERPATSKPSSSGAAAVSINSSAAKKKSGSSEPITVSNLHIDIEEVGLSRSAEFSYFEPGHFGEKTQYMGRKADEFGGAYAVHCRNSLPFSIEVKYSNGGIKRDDALKVMQRLLPGNVSSITEHDDDDLKKRDATQAAEFFYYEGGWHTELLYANDSIENVVQVNVWSREG